MATGGGYLFIGTGGTSSGSGGTSFTGNVTASGSFLGGNGTAAAPTHSFSGATSTGTYYDSGNTALGFAVSGTEYLYLQSSQLVNTTGQFIVGNPNDSTGVQLKNLGGNQLYITTGSGGSYALINARGVTTPTATSASSAAFFGSSASTGLYFPSSSSLGLSASGASGLLMDSNQRISQVKHQAASKTANYTVLAADSFTDFDNAGAAGVVTFTLPTAALGLNFTFSAVVAQQIKVQAGGSDAISMSGNSKAAGGLLTGPAATQGASVTIKCTSANMWTVTAFQGTWS